MRYQRYHWPLFLDGSFRCFVSFPLFFSSFYISLNWFWSICWDWSVYIYVLLWISGLLRLKHVLWFPALRYNVGRVCCKFCVIIEVWLGLWERQLVVVLKVGCISVGSWSFNEVDDFLLSPVCSLVGWFFCWVSFSCIITGYGLDFEIEKIGQAGNSGGEFNMLGPFCWTVIVSISINLSCSEYEQMGFVVRPVISSIDCSKAQQCMQEQRVRYAMNWSCHMVLPWNRLGSHERLFLDCGSTE